MTEAERRFMETVPARLRGIEEKLEKISDTLDRFTDALLKLIENGHGKDL